MIQIADREDHRRRLRASLPKTAISDGLSDSSVPQLLMTPQCERPPLTFDSETEAEFSDYEAKT